MAPGWIQAQGGCHFPSESLPTGGRRIGNVVNFKVLEREEYMER